MGTKIVAFTEGNSDYELRVDKIVADHVNQNDPTNKWFYCFVADCFDPVRYLVAGESFEDAYDWLLCDPSVERDIKVEFDSWFVRDYGTNVYVKGLTYNEACEEVAKYNVEIGRLTYNDNGTLVDPEPLMMSRVARIKVVR